MKDVASDDNSEFHSALEIDSSRKGNNASNRLWSWKAKLLIGFSIILSVMMVLFILEFTKPTQILRSVKTKRFVKMDDCFEESENTETVQNDIHIIPEGQVEDLTRQANQHPNHRYLEIEPEGDIYKKIMKDLYDESDLSPKPFEVRREEYLSSIRNIISKKKPKGKNTRGKFPNLKSLEGSLRFKGVFGYVSSKKNLIKNPGAKNFYYPKEINNLMQNYSDGEGEKNTVIKKAFKSHGAPFQVPVKDVPQRERLNMFRSSSSKPKQSRFKERFKKKPLTILLDIYPMAKNDDYFKKEGPKLSHVIKPWRNELSKPRDIHSTGKFLFPQESRNGIIMKLNLYAKDRKFSRRQNSAREASDSKKVKEKSFGCFRQKKKNRRRNSAP